MEIYIHTMGAPKYIKQFITNNLINNNIIIIGDFNNPSTSMERQSTENPQQKNGFEWPIRPDRPKRHIKNTPS